MPLVSEQDWPQHASFCLPPQEAASSLFNSATLSLPLQREEFIISGLRLSEKNFFLAKIVTYIHFHKSFYHKLGRSLLPLPKAKKILSDNSWQCLLPSSSGTSCAYLGTQRTELCWQIISCPGKWGPYRQILYPLYLSIPGPTQCPAYSRHSIHIPEERTWMPSEHPGRVPISVCYATTCWLTSLIREGRHHLLFNFIPRMFGISWLPKIYFVRKKKRTGGYSKQKIKLHCLWPPYTAWIYLDGSLSWCQRVTSTVCPSHSTQGWISITKLP